MIQRQSTSALSSLVRDLRNPEPVVDIKHFAPAGSGLARIVASVVHTSESRENPSLVLSSLRKKFDNRLCGIAGSFKSLDLGPVTEVISGVVSVVKESVAVKPGDELKGFRAMAANMFMDDEANMWQLKKTTSGDLLVRSTGIEDDEALLSVLRSCSSAGSITSESRAMASFSSEMAAKVEGGDYISFVNANESISQGFVVAKTDDDRLVVLAHNTACEEIISTAAVVDIHSTEGFPLPKLSEQDQMNLAVATASGQIDLQGMLDYYKQIYSSDPSFYEKFAAQINSHVFA